LADIKKMTVKDLEKKIKDLTGLGETEAAEKYQEELDSRQGKSASSSGGVSKDDWDKSGSKFAIEGLHKAEFYAATWKTMNVSVELGFVLNGEDDEDSGKEGQIFPGVTAKGIWQFKNACKALGIEPIFKGGVLDVNAMLPKFAGKEGMVQYITQVDTRTPEQGGKGGRYTKPVAVLALGTEPPDEAPY